MMHAASVVWYKMDEADFNIFQKFNGEQFFKIYILIIIILYCNTFEYHKDHGE